MLTTWRLRPARRGGFGLGLRPHTAAAPAPGWGGPRAPGTERTGPPPSSRALGGRPGAQGDSPRGGPASSTHAAKARPEQTGPWCCWDPVLTRPGKGAGEGLHPPCRESEPGWRGQGRGRRWARQLWGFPLSFATDPWLRGDLTSLSFNFLPSQVCMILILPSSEGCCEHSSVSLQ